MTLRIKWLVAALFGVMGLAAVRPASAQNAPDAGREPYDYPYTFPVWGQKLAERGIGFPLPWGVGVNYAYADQAVDIPEVAIAVNDSEFVDLTDIIKFESVQSKLHAANARLDLWAFPFLNVYGMFNYIVESDTDVLLSDPFALQAGANQRGYGGGFGFTGAFGFWGFFGTVDINWTWNQMEKLDDPVRTFLLTPRVGKNFGDLGPVEVAVWVGAMRQEIEADTSGSISLKDTLGGGSGGDFQDKLGDWYDNLPPGRQALVDAVVDRLSGAEDATIHYRLKKKLHDPWNMLVGTEVGLSQAWRLRAEFGFLGRTQLILGANYRFGLF